MPIKTIEAAYPLSKLPTMEHAWVMLICIYDSDSSTVAECVLDLDTGDTALGWLAV